MDKRVLVTQLGDHLRQIARTAHDAALSAAAEARGGATAKEKREDARVALEYSGLAKGQDQRAQRAFQEVQTLEGLKPTALRRGARVQLGAIVEVEDCDTGEGRTFFLAPVGAGVTLTGPDGDGYLTVVTPHSPVGKAVLGKREGDVIDITVKGDVREWQICWVE